MILVENRQFQPTQLYLSTHYWGHTSVGGDPIEISSILWHYKTI